MGIKYVEYSHKIHEGVVWGASFAPTATILDEVRVGPTPLSKLVIEGTLEGKDDTNNTLILTIDYMRAPAEGETPEDYFGALAAACFTAARSSVRASRPT